MDKIDPRILSAFEKGAPEVAVVVVCDDCDAAERELSAAGIRVGTAAKSIGVLSATIRKTDLPALGAAKTVTIVEPDEAVSSF